MNLYLIRHTKVAMPKGICYGNADVELAESFEEELAKVKQGIEGICFSLTYCSPLKRCVKLAKALSQDVVIDSRIAEYSFGKWELMSWEDIYLLNEGKKWFNDYVNVSTPEGESYLAMTDRVKSFISQLPSTKDNILIITHAGIIRSFLVQLQNFTISQSFDTKIDYGQIVKISV